MIRSGRTLAWGQAEATALVLAEPLSFWGGVDSATGMVIDHSHPDRGRSITGTILVMPGGRGSSSAASVLAEMIRTGTAPAAIVLGTADPILTVGAIVAESLYGLTCPIALCATDGISTGDRLRVTAVPDGQAQLETL